MSKLTQAICLTLVLLFATPVMAEQWTQKSSLLPGEYMVVYLNRAQTSNLLYYQAMAAAQGTERIMEISQIMEGIVFTINKEFGTDGLCQYLNTDPLTHPETEPFLLQKVDDGWKPIDMPCRWSEAVEFDI